MVKIVQVDNFGRDNVSDRLIATEVPADLADIMVKALNKERGGIHSPAYFVVRPEDYVLYGFEP